MADPKRPAAKLDIEADEVETNRALEQGLGVGARELAAIHESGAEGTLEREGEARPEDEEGLEVGETGRSASVLDRHDKAQVDKTQPEEQLDKDSEA